MDEALYRQMRELEDRHWWFSARRRIVESVLARLPLGGNAKILDVGCGTGGNLAMLARFGAVMGAEYDADAAALARARNVAPVVRAALPDRMPFQASQFQLVTLFDVLEHIDDDRASLATLAGLLRPGGFLVLTVPAFPFLWSAHDTEHHHQRRYRAAQLREHIMAAGLNVQWLSYYNSVLFPPVAMVRLLGKIVPHKSVGSDVALPPAPLNALLESVFAGERHWLGKVPVPFGVSLIAVARKQ